MRTILVFFLLFSFSFKSFAGSLEERVKRLEEKVKVLEERLNRLEGKKTSENLKQEGLFLQKEETPYIVVSSPEDIVDFKVLKKRFEKTSIKESLWKRYDQIILKVKVKSKLKKEISAIKGKVVILDKKGNILMEGKVNINKALNFLRGTTIKPGETLRYTIYLTYNGKNPKHRFVRDASLDELDIKLYPTEIDFPDGTVKYVKYRGK